MMLRTVLAALVGASLMLAPQQSNDDGAQPPASQPASQPTVRTKPRSPVQARILQELLRATERGQVKPILPELPDGARGAGDAGATDGASLLLDGTPLSERPGRLVRAGERSEFHFKPGSPAEKAPRTMEFNRNALLEAMEAEAAVGVEEFIITAEVSRYRGRNYLLLLKYRRVVSHGNLGP